MCRGRIATLLIAAAGFAAVGCQPIDQKQAVGHFVQGQLYADSGDLDAALRELAKAVRADPDLSIAHAAMGNIHRRRGDYGLARVCYESACEANPYAFRPHYNLGVVYQYLSDAAKGIDEARDYLRRAVGVYVRAILLEPDDFEANLNLGACYFSLEKYELAEKYCKAAIALKPDSPEAYSNLGIIYDSQGRLYEAIKAYKDSLELDVHQPKLLMNLGATYMRQDRLTPALKAFELAVREAPDSAPAREQLGTCLYHRKEYDKAIEAYEQAISIDRESAASHRGLGVVYMTQYVLHPGNAALREQALKAWHRSLELEPDQQDIVTLVRKYTPKPGSPDL